MALFGHDLDVRRMNSSPPSVLGIGEDGSVIGDGHGGKCTAGRVKSCLKGFIAQLFSHVGLCALVIGYSVLGAVIFAYLEKGNEMEIRDKVGNTRKETLDELYSITGKPRKTPLSYIMLRPNVGHYSNSPRP